MVNEPTKYFSRYSILSLLPRTENCIEVGIQTGHYTHILAQKFKNVVSIDPFKEYSQDYYTDTANIPQSEQDLLFERVSRELPENVKIIRESSLDVDSLLEDNFYDFVHLDGNHSYEYLLQELPLFWKKLRVGGILSGHDYYNLEREGLKIEVEKAVNQFVEENKLELVLANQTCSSWFILKN